MSSLLSINDKANVATILDNIFDTWSRNIIIYKEPIKQQILPQDSTAVFGFGTSQGTELYNYIPVTGVYPAVIRYNERLARNDSTAQFQPEIDEYISNAPVSIKVRADAKDFIIVGKTQKIDIDGFSYILDAIDPRTDFVWGNLYYIFDLERKL